MSVLRSALSLAFVAGALSVSLYTPAALADEIVLVNGDKITGRIVEKSGNDLAIDTANDGIVRVKWEQIAAVTTDAPMDAALAATSAPRTPLAAQHDDCAGASARSSAADL